MGSDKKSKKDKKKKDKKKKHSRHSSDSGSDSDSDSHLRKKQKRREEKELLKQELHVQKEAHLAEQMAAQLGYSNTDNPFGDQKLHQKFVWVKKREKEMKAGISREERMQRDAEKKGEVEIELERLKALRNQRELDLQLREQEAARLRREQDREALGDWERREDNFHWQQAKTRAKIRISEGRAKPIDLLAINVSLASDTELAQEFNALGFEMDTDEPYLIFANLNLSEVQDLHKDIRLYMELETRAENKPFWESLLIVCDAELGRLERVRDESKGTIPKLSKHEIGVQEDITSMLAGKSYAQLQTIQTQVETRLSGESGPVDVEFWEAVMKGLVVWKAKAKLKDMHKQFLEIRLGHLREEAASGSAPATYTAPAYMKKPPTSTATDSSSSDVKATVKLGRSLLVGSSSLAAKEAAEKAAKALKEMESVSAARGAWDEDSNVILRGEDGFVEKYDPSMSPLITDDLMREDRAFDLLDEDEDYEELMNRRRAILEELSRAAEAAAATTSAASSAAKKDDAPASVLEAAFIKSAADEMEDDEEAFMEEAKLAGLDKTTYLWQDKYRPRKPRFFNRVHTGYEWNKYNQTHYDSDNPPPKVVQGYKFNIFYPDLIDKNKTPTYKIVRDAGYPDTVVLRFIASAPYEDIAFRIVNKEWEYSHKNGFRSSFDRGVLQLHFHFKRQFYRR
ncbi:cactus-binding C-terminus of cactin protein-domain-containing protein [Obelidium mucronatum]|nr:cactus-binding C-terminus of cactin protein-domain-containing protein [Obelidium mucronatum]